ncbi:hypothetical protein ACERK3_13655 [Phycisphaerales bacterium AB-hyl4]|uniref:Uncharacterized protein n=1 Tax=Natronomicrosphaera hydrolytica TaxID=3242702 RepID=A0ABV4U6X4_9BACT
MPGKAMTIPMSIQVKRGRPTCVRVRFNTVHSGKGASLRYSERCVGSG